MENVPGMLTIGNGTIVKEIKRKLATLGYESCTKILFAEDFGVPQKRRRAFVIATMLGWESLIFPRGTHGPSPKPSEQANSYIYRWEPRNDKVAQQQVTVWNAISDLPPVKNGGGEEAIPYRRKPRTDFQKEIRRGSQLIHNHRGHQLTPPMIRRIKNVPEGGNWRDIPRQWLPAGMKRARKSDHTKRYGRLARKGLSSTILTKCDPHWGSYVHPLEDRTITVREAARLQTFPDRFRFSDSLSKQYELVGNAVPPLLARQIARSVMRHITRKSRPKLHANTATTRRARP
jgi:DNA (cytosine-5)-methyltransferase 1